MAQYTALSRTLQMPHVHVTSQSNTMRCDFNNSVACLPIAQHRSNTSTAIDLSRFSRLLEMMPSDIRNFNARSFIYSIGGLVVKLAVAISRSSDLECRPAPGSIPGRCMVLSSSLLLGDDGQSCSLMAVQDCSWMIKTRKVVACGHRLERSQRQAFASCTQWRMFVQGSWTQHQMVMYRRVSVVVMFRCFVVP